MLSLCMIVKDEGEILNNCLLNVAKFVDEIIIVDTGSTDRTKEIALKYTDKVYDFKWCNDFSKARNFSISKSSNAWILVLDADEFVNNIEEIEIKEFCNYINNKVVGRIKIINEYEDNYGIKKYIKRVNRVFNKNYFEYEGVIHEQIVSKNRKQYITNNINLDVYHIGYTNEVLKKTNKIERNIELLKNTIKENSNDPYLYYQLGKSYFMKKIYKSAYEYFKISLSIVNNFTYEYVEDLVESYGYTLLNMNLFYEAKELVEFKELYIKSPDFIFLLALIEMNNENFEKAIECFLQCTKFNHGRIEGITSFLPLYNIGVILECLGFKEEALQYYNMCGTYIPALNRIKKYTS
ncbi:glycosyltransferase family 2 protein [Clostridium saccharobutylicum]|uniref:SPBc2 prophage-derived glycosyltransferase SunS n=1 Tax=Clostridium saccharobutylicum TaxID=169679 RepID=A0A1S8NIF6_CLOSA|nr:glycosyltransferase family 2 protein [Clostridium saccharobutylicum]OOM16266.1 SPBc2 prophage-derived glycosyltransferase SunS [Clostridium saccharobutylicum]